MLQTGKLESRGYTAVEKFLNSFSLEMCGNRFFVLNPSHFSDVIPIPIPIRRVNRLMWVFMKTFLRAACLCYQHIKESKLTDEKWIDSIKKKLNFNSKEW